MTYTREGLFEKVKFELGLDKALDSDESRLAESIPEIKQIQLCYLI